jgi:ABC-type branched-subunit amino acid transport system ATPase component
MLDVRNLDAGYGPVQVLTDVSLRVEPGESVCVLGRNGVGKTTLLRSIIGHNPAWRGSVSCDGDRIDGLAPFDVARRGIAYVPQDKQLLPALTVEQNLFLAVRQRSLFKQRLPRMLELFPVVAEKLRVAAGSLSGGQQQAVALARALIAAPKLLLLDEPTVGIQPSIVRELRETLARIVAEEQCALLLVEQNRSLALHVASRAYVMDRGRVVAEGTPLELEAAGAIERHLAF